MHPSMPPLAFFGSSFVIFALAIGMIAAHTVLFVRTSERVRPGPGRLGPVPFLAGGFLTAWLAVGLAVGNPAALPIIPPRLRAPLFLLIGFGPMLAAALALFASRTLRTLNGAMPRSWLVGIQTYRVAGIMFLFPFLFYGVVPAGFAWPAAVGDFLTGLAAPFVAAALAERRRGAIALAIGWNLFGIADLIVAPAAAILSHAQVLTLFPLVVVPLFLGPPLGTLTHIYSLRNLLVTRRALSLDNGTIEAGRRQAPKSPLNTTSPQPAASRG